MTSARVTHDKLLEEAVEQARSAAEDIAREGLVGDHLGIEYEGKRTLTHYFDSREPGYSRWRWAVTVSRVPRGKTVTVCEVELLPGEGSLIAPPWIPLDERFRSES